VIVRYLLLLAGCNFGTLGFTCSTDSQCGGNGRCIAKACAFPAAMCPSGYAFDKSAPSDKSGLCAVSEPMYDLSTPAVEDLAVTPSTSPTPKPIGASCTLSSDCDSGQCVDGVCCDSACAGACATCNVLAHPGHCETVADGQPDPHGLCTSADPCGLDGSCRAGACALRAKDAICAPQSCSAGVLSLTRRCDGAGTCVAASTRSCDPYVCLPDGSDCYAQCTGANSGCKAPNSCTSGLCGKALNGAVCSTPDACASGNCTDNRCCASSSCNTCYACNVAGHEGACYTIPGGTTDPRCLSFDPSTCSYNGTCDGSGACAFWPAGTECKKPYCYKCNAQPTSPDCAATIHEYCPGNGAVCPSGTPTVLVCGAPSRCVYNGVGDNVTCQ
jgi:hypothetical protein